MTYVFDRNNQLTHKRYAGVDVSYQYNEYDELEESRQYIDGVLVTTSYRYDAFGNQISESVKEGTKVYQYNDKNQVEKIQTKDGTIEYEYDKNGNVSKKVNEDGRVDQYRYDDLNQLIELSQGQYTYSYHYDAQKERIQQVRTDTKDYHYDKWYSYREPLDLVTDQEVEGTFEQLRKQASKKEENDNTCSSILHDSYDVTYYQEPEVTEYILDRNVEYSEVLASNDTIHVYGETLLQTDGTDTVTGWNNSVIAKVDDTIERIRYNDYGATKDITSGHGYNGEMMDDTGLVYLRARYYEPDTGRFIQIDNNYEGESESVVSQNRYVYTLNNPYKYVDRNGNFAIAIGTFITVKALVGIFVVGAVTATVLVQTEKKTKLVEKTLNNVVSAVKDIAKGIGRAATNVGSFISKYEANGDVINNTIIQYAQYKLMKEIECPEDK